MKILILLFTFLCFAAPAFADEVYDDKVLEVSTPSSLSPMLRKIAPEDLPVLFPSMKPAPKVGFKQKIKNKFSSLKQKYQGTNNRAVKPFRWLQTESFKFLKYADEQTNRLGHWLEPKVPVVQTATCGFTSVIPFVLR